MLRELRSKWGLLLGLALAVALAYGSVVDNGLYEFDDPGVLDHISRGVPPTQHFRPLYSVWNTLLYRLFGLTIWPYYVADLAIHAGCAWACALLVRRLTSSASAATAAGLVFALFYSPHQVVLWISANCGLLSAGFVLIAAVQWLTHVTTESRRSAVLAWTAAVGAMASKEECVVLGPLLLGIDACVHGTRAFRFRTLAQRYAVFALLACGYLALAFRPGLWSHRASVGRYEFGPDLVPRLLGNFALLFAIGQGHPAETSPAAVLLGGVLITALVAAAVRWKEERRLIATGLAVALFGLMPALPGPFPIAGTRYAYPAVIGVALIAGALAAGFERWTAARKARAAWRGAAAVGFALWLGVQVAAIRSIESWRYASGCRRFRNLIESTGAAAISLRKESPAPRRLAVVAPDVWNVSDYLSGVRLFLGGSALPAGVEWIPAAPDAEALTAPGGRFDRATVPLFASFDEGRIERLDPRDLGSALARLAKARAPYAEAHPGMLPVVWFSVSQAGSGG